MESSILKLVKEEVVKWVVVYLLTCFFPVSTQTPPPTPTLVNVTVQNHLDLVASASVHRADTVVYIHHYYHHYQRPHPHKYKKCICKH
jgi:hypothetical protein